MLEKSKLKIHILTPTVFKKMGQNIFDFSLDQKLTFFAQNVGKKKDYFRFKGICKVKDLGLITKKKVDSNTLLSDFSDHNEWLKLEPQDIMPNQSIKKSDLKHFLGLFNETICILYENANEEIFSETINLINFNNAKILLPKCVEHNKIENIIAICYGIICLYFWARYYSSLLLYTLAFILILGLLLYMMTFLTFKVKEQIRVAYESNENFDKIEMKNETKHKLNLDFCLIGKVNGEEKVIDEQKIVIIPNNISPIFPFIKNKNIQNIKLVLNNGKEKKVYYLN